jgi:hypothetical protein
VKSKKAVKLSFVDKIINFLGSNSFFWLIVGIFVIQAGWLAVSASYPMLYDEYYHPGFIDIYSQQLSPFIESQSDSVTERYGDLTRSNSYLFHYIMSFPYRIITGLSDSFYLAIVSLRLINVFFVAAGLFIYRKLLIEANFSSAVINASLFILTMIPVFPHVAAHVNYDNLLFLLTPAFLLYGLRIIDSKKVNSKNLIIFVSLGAIASLVKFSFLPIFAVAFVYVTLKLIRKKRSKLPNKIYQSLMSNSKKTVFLLAVLSILSVGLFVERHIGNLIMYGSVKPTCKLIQSEETCNKQPVQKRNKNATESQINNPQQLYNIVDYTRIHWVPNTLNNSIVGGVNIGAEERERFDYKLKSSEGAAPIPILIATVWTMFLVSIILVSYSWRELRQMKGFGYFSSILLVYLLSVWIITNYLGYLKTGQPFAIQPRYFILLMPLIFAYITQAASFAIKTRAIKVGIFVILTVLLTQGGGISTYVTRSNEGWYWQRKSIIDSNMQLQKILKPIIKEN